MRFFNYLTLVVFTLVLPYSFFSCNENEDDPEITLPAGSGMIVVNQGLWGLNNATLTYVNLNSSEIIDDVFNKVNKKGLGDTGQDILVYGTKIYTAVTVSALIHILDRESFEQITTIESKNELQPRNPRNLVAHNGKVYVSYQDGYVARIDTTSLEITDLVKVGSNPEQMAVTNGKLYVTNSGGMSATLDNTVSVIDLATFKEEKKIEVELNPTKIAADNAGNVFVISMRADFGMSTTLLQKIDTNGEVTRIEDANFAHLTVHKNTLYTICAKYGSDEVLFMTYNTLTGKKENENFLKGDDLPPNPTTIAIHPVNGHIFVGSYASLTDYQSNGFIYHFTSTGELHKKYDAGIGPNAVSFLN